MKDMYFWLAVKLHTVVMEYCLNDGNANPMQKHETIYSMIKEAIHHPKALWRSG